MTRNAKGQFVHTTGAGRYKRIMVDGRNLQMHRYVWEQHNGPIPAGYIIHHINGNKKDNRLENLSCLTQQEHNKLHAKDREPWNKGLTAGTSAKWKNTMEKALRVRREHSFAKCRLVKELRKSMSAREIGAKLGLCTRQVQTLLHRYDELKAELACQ